MVVSHDRYFMDSVVDHLFVFEGKGDIRDFPGNYSQYFDQKKKEEAQEQHQQKQLEEAQAKNTASSKEKKKPSNKLSYKEKRELEKLPEMIERLENEQQQIETRVSDPDFYQSDEMEIKQSLTRLELLQEELAKAYDRWAYLEKLM